MYLHHQVTLNNQDKQDAKNLIQFIRIFVESFLHLTHHYCDFQQQKPENIQNL